MHYEASLVIKVPREKAYSAYTEFEAAPKWSKRSNPVRVVRREAGSVYLVDVDARTGKNSGAEVQMKLFPPQRVESEGDTRFTKTKRIVRFEEVPEGTRVTAVLEMQIKGHWSWILRTRGKSEAESSALEELASFAKYVESLP